MSLKTLGLLTLWGLAGLTPALQGAPRKQDTPPAASAPIIEPRALALLERVQKRMAAVRSLTARSQTTITRLGPKKRSLITTTRLRLMRPNLTHADIVWSRQPAGTDPAQAAVIETFATDGRTTWRLWDQTNDLTSWPTDPDGADSEKDLPGPLRGFFDKHLLPTAFLKAIEDQHLLRRLRFLGTQSWQGAEYQVVRLEYQKAGTSLIETDDYDIGPDSLIHHLTCAWGDTRIQAGLTDLHLDPPLTRASFAYAPPPTAQVHLAVSMPQGQTLPLGTLAPDFTLTAADGRPIHLADLRGKVVVLDFWATWCGNCLQEFPGDSALARKYADQGVVVMAVDVCDAPDVYRRWVTAHPEYKDMVFALDPQGINGKGINTTLYKGASLPAQYVIDRTGHLAAALSGYDGDPKEATLETAIRKACGLNSDKE